MSGMYGADVAQLRALGETMARGAETLESMLGQVGPPSLSSIQDQIDSGKPVVASTKTTGDDGWKADDDVVANHTYIVDSVSADGEKITLINPWGPDGGTGRDGEHKPGHDHADGRRVLQELRLRDDRVVDSLTHRVAGSPG
ncbi:hypothetical protein L1785_05095 [Antribacter sp. KLBMP9083]|uniref:Calpain catalytic domain-containing protein n=1 Tax=Antribacter soli TaxID=2910976 RepID=A0AA41QD01_9MICO|nr:hypothetical protein [Antribacter soli]MCF4120351.1 hypothetical protein [Antribacter soli]